jgi:general secretion pathway protein A
VYETFFGFKKAPFLAVPDPALLFLSPQHQRALALLEYAILTRAGFCVITGDVGAGKTTLVRRLLQKTERNIHVGLVSNTTCESFEELLQWILLAFDLDYQGKAKVELYDTVVAFLIEQHRKGRPVTLIIDEAQNLDPRLLEQLRMLSNLNTERGLLLQTILVGQPDLWDVLKRPELEQFAQRISYDFFLAPLDSAELTGQYIRHRLTAAGGNSDLFPDATYSLIWEATGGVPRLINLVCDAALLYCYAEQLDRVELRIVEQVLNDKARGFAPIGRGSRSPSTVDAQPLATMPDPPGPKQSPSRRSTIERAVQKMRDITQ